MRLLIRCPDCRQKYDASKRKIGSKFRCRCGQVVEIAQPRAHTAAVVHCEACGAAREEAARACSFCGSDFTLHEQDLNTVCPGCLARVSDRARYCHHCATPLSVEAVAGEEQSFHCPVCEDRRLVSRRLESIATTALECQVCAGLWIGLESFHDLLTQEARGDSGECVSHRRPDSPAKAGKRYRPCPVCRELMLPRLVGRSGIVLDICGEHGIWFDCDELSHLIAWMRGGGLEAVAEMAGKLKGSPDFVRKRMSSAPAPRDVFQEDGDGSWGNPCGGGNAETRERTQAELLLEIGLPLLVATGTVIARMFLK